MLSGLCLADKRLSASFMTEMNNSGMFRTGLRIALLITVLSGGGCTVLPGPVDRTALIDDLVQQQEFGRARELLSELDTRDPQYGELANRRRALRPLIQQYEESAIKKATAAQRKNRWQNALTTIDEALDKLLESERLSSIRKQMLLQRDSYIRDLEYQIQLIDSQSIPRKKRLLERRVNAAPDNVLYRLELYSHNQAVSTAMQDMITCTSEAQTEGNFNLSARCLRVAEALASKPSQEEKKVLAKLRRKQDKISDLQRLGDAQQARQQEQAQLQRLKQEYRDLIAAGWWLAARDKMTELQARAPSGDEDIPKWLSELQQIIDTQVQLGLKQGQALYSQGFLAQALNVWRQTSALDPENPELIAHIARVERFLNKLKKLNANEG